MNALLLRTLELKKSPSLQTFAQYREAESQNCRNSSVTSEGELLEHQTLELRVHPPNVTVDNDTYDDRTIITVDSANRPGTLVEVVQCLTELGLNVKKARISSDGGWFVDEFHVTEVAAGHSPQSRKVVSERKLKVIKSVLSVDYEPEQEPENNQHGPTHHRQPSGTFDEVWQHSTVFELAGQDRSGLLADVLQLLTHNGCNVGSAAVWTYSGRAAFVLSVVDGGTGEPIRDAYKLGRLKQLLHEMMDQDGNGIVTAQAVKGLVHYERRLHQLLLKEEEKDWQRNKDHILARLRLKSSNCSCTCHIQHQLLQQQGPDGQGLNGPTSTSPQQQQQQVGSGLQGSMTNGGSSSSSSATPIGLPQPVLSPQLLQQHQQHQQQQGLGAPTAGKCCCCQEEQAERHIVHSELPPLSSAHPQPHHHTPSSSASTQEELTEAERLLISPKYSRPYVTIQHYCHLNYWLVTIRCKDRNKLFFDTVCTLSDLNYDVYHGAIDQEGDYAVQLYYIRPRFGDFFWDTVKATKLRVMLEAAIQRRFPKGLKVHVRQRRPNGPSHLGDNWLADMTAAWKEAHLWITRAKVRAYTNHFHTLYVMDEQGQPPDPAKVQTACDAGGGLMQGPPEGLPLGVSPPSIASIGSNTKAPTAAAAASATGDGQAGMGAGAKFFYMLQKRGGWDGSPSSMTSM